MKIKITEVAPQDGHYPIRNLVIGQEGTFRVSYQRHGWQGGFFVFNTPLKINNELVEDLIFYKIKYLRMDNEPAQKLGVWGLLLLALRAKLRK